MRLGKPFHWPAVPLDFILGKIGWDSRRTGSSHPVDLKAQMPCLEPAGLHSAGALVRVGRNDYLWSFDLPRARKVLPQNEERPDKAHSKTQNTIENLAS